MSFPAYIFPQSVAHKARIRLDNVNVSEPMLVHSGPHAGMMFLDAGLAERDPRWIPLFEPLIADPVNQVQLVTLTAQEIAPPYLP